MTLEKALRYVVLAGVFALPFIVLYVSSSLFFPFITGKNFAFRFIVEIIAGAWIALALVNTEYRPRRSWLIWAFAAFVVLIGISDMLGAYPGKSFWSNFERMEGWVTLAHLFVYFVVAVSVLNTEKLWNYWWHTSLGVSVLVAGYGLLQLAGLATINQGGVRLDATFGNATYLAVYMLFHIFITGLFLARTWVEKGPGDRGPLVASYGVLIALHSFILFFTATRGAMLGLLGGAVLAALILIVIAPRSRVAWRAGVVVIGIIILLGGLWAARDSAWVRSSGPLHRLASISLSDLTTQARFMNWRMASEGFSEHPILGWGQENYAAVFDKNYNPEMYAQEQWFDRVHNIVFDWLIAGGLLGLLAYLSLYFFALFALWRSGAFAPYERAILTGLFAGYFFYLLFTFDNITSYLLFISLLAYITIRANAAVPVPSETRVQPLSPKSLPVVTVVAVVVVSGVMWFANADLIRANHALINAISPQQAGAAQNLEYFQEALSYGQGTQEVREQFAQASMSIVGIEGIPNELKQQFVQMASEELAQQTDDAPHNARAPFFLGILLDRAGAFTEAKQALDTALERSPQKQGILFEAGLNAFARGANDEAVAIFKEAYDAAPAYNEAGVYYAAALFRSDRVEEANSFIQNSLTSSDMADTRLVNARLLRAGIDYSSGKTARAIQILEALKHDVPETTSEVDELIQQMRAGVLLQ